jgi:hypothetical protein
MRQLVDTAPTRTPAVRDHRERHDHDQPSPRAIRMWAMLQALGYAGALIDPTGVLTARRFRRAEQQEASRHAGR